MLISISCRNCSHPFKVDSAFVGTMRKCPSCDFRFLLDDTVAEEDGTSLDNLRGQKVGCPECLRTFIPMIHPGEVEDVPCRYCNHHFEHDVGVATFEAVNAASKIIRKGLLLGKSDDQIQARLTKSGSLNVDSLETLIGFHTKNLPFLRREVLVFGGRETAFVRARSMCDLCNHSVPYDTAEITWRLTQQTAENSLTGAMALSLLVGGPASGLVGRVETHNSDKIGIYFLCSPCLKPLVSWWKRFTRRPMHDEYQVHTVRRCWLENNESNTTIRYK